MIEQFKLVKEDKDLILIENIDYIIKIYLYNKQTEMVIKIYYKQSCTNKTFYKSKYANFIPQKYRDTIDSFLVLHKLTL